MLVTGREKVVVTSSELPSLTELLAEIRELQIENRNLRSYMEAFKRFDDEYLFSSEKILEGWLEDNIYRIFPELDILDRQPHAKWPDGKFGKLDLLAFNKETKAIAIVEVKTRKRRSASGYDQFVRYTTWATKNKINIINTYKLPDETSSAKVEFYIISDAVNDEMRAICEEYEIKLVKIMGGIGFQKL
jgi:Holliday junction resolvase-like predicted endonuclease